MDVGGNQSSYSLKKMLCNIILTYSNHSQVGLYPSLRGWGLSPLVILCHLCHTKRPTGSASNPVHAGVMGTPSTWLILNGIGVHTGIKQIPTTY